MNNSYRTRSKVELAKEILKKWEEMGLIILVRDESDSEEGADEV